jgi:hypothetical protein
MLMSATTTKEGEPYDDLAELYSRMLGQWTVEMNHVAAIVGGFDTQEKYVGQEGVIFTPVSKERQKSAVSFINENTFATPKWAIDAQILRRIEAVGVLGSIRNAQTSVLANLLGSARFNRLVEQEAVDGAPAYKPSDFLADVRKGIWKELDSAQVRIDPYRRNLQRAYLDLVNTKVNANGAGGEERPLYRAELKSLSASLAAAIAKTSDRETKAHLEDSRNQIAKILDPKYAPAGANGGTVIRIGFDAIDPLWGIPDPEGVCWPDYAIRPN